MNINNARYLQQTVDTEDGSIQYDGVNYAISVEIDEADVIVPLDPANRHYAEILRQVDAGTLTIQEAE